MMTVLEIVVITLGLIIGYRLGCAHARATHEYSQDKETKQVK